ncbi:MAG: hypothetical protein ACTSYI_17950 [Promethearchaeota archaeon]
MRKDWRDVLFNMVVGIPIFIVLWLCYTGEILTIGVIAVIALGYVTTMQIFWFFWLKPRIVGRGS